MSTSDEHSHIHPERDIGFHLTLTEEDRDLLYALARRMSVSRTETISRALHLLQAGQEQGRHDAP
jgi:hypothetical protein